MRWPFARSEPERLHASEEVAVEPVSEIHRSPGLEATLVKLREDRSCHVLDLGAAEAQSIEFLSRFPCRVTIADLIRRLDDEPGMAAKIAAESGDVFRDLLPDDRQLFDVVLAWTVFDHMDREAARRLAAQLARRTRPNGLLFAMVATESNVRSGGLSFAIRDRSALEYRPVRSHAGHGASMLNPASFAQLLTGFAIEHSFVLRHGIREYVAVRLDDATGPRRH